MIGLCLGALVAGLAAAAVLPFLPFACAVIAAVALGAAWALAEGASPGQAASWAVALLFAGQIGYGLGIVLAALLGHGAAARRLGGAERAPPAARPLRTGNGPR